MSVWNGMPGWFGNKGSKSALDELEKRASQKSVAERNSNHDKKLQEIIEMQRNEYVTQLQQQWHQAQYQAGLVNQQAAASNWGLQNVYADPTGGFGTGGGGGYGISTVTYPMTTTGITTVSTGSFPSMPGGIYTYPTGNGGGSGLHSHPVMMPQSPITPMTVNPSPKKGDRVEFEFDGEKWMVKYEKYAHAHFERHQDKGEFSLDELDEAQRMIEELSTKEKQVAETRA